MNHKVHQPARVAGNVRGSLFNVWTDEAGNPCFPDSSTPALPPDCFVWVDPDRQPREGEYALLSMENKVVFDRLVRKDCQLSWERTASLPGSLPEVMVLGVVISGIEWLAIPEES